MTDQQLIITAEQGEDHASFIAHGGDNIWTLTQPVEPQPERIVVPGRVNWKWGDMEFISWEGHTAEELRDIRILAHNWQQVNGNDGEPVKGERVELCCLVTTADCGVRFYPPRPLVIAVATLAAVPAVEMVIDTTEPERGELFSVQWQLSQEQSE